VPGVSIITAVRLILARIPCASCLAVGLKRRVPGLVPAINGFASISCACCHYEVPDRTLSISVAISHNSLAVSRLLVDIASVLYTPVMSSLAVRLELESLSGASYHNQLSA
jgi:hypothetical protein